MARIAVHPVDGSNADFTPHREQRHSFRDQIIAKTTSFANFQRELLKTPIILRVYMTHVNTFDNKNILREPTFNPGRM